MADRGGRVSFPVPSFCREDICEIAVGWWGESIGAFNSGLSWEISFIQWADGNWQAGPAASIAGASLTEGHGRNGNGTAERISGWWSTGSLDDSASSWFVLFDDLAPENGQYKITFQLHQGDPAHPALTSLILFICPG